jgi:RAB protein geranylgeranyltransferase component A
MNTNSLSDTHLHISNIRRFVSFKIHSRHSTSNIRQYIPITRNEKEAQHSIVLHIKEKQQMMEDEVSEIRKKEVEKFK